MACNEYIENLIERFLEKVLEDDLDKGDFTWEEYIRIKVVMNITKPM